MKPRNIRLSIAVLFSLMLLSCSEDFLDTKPTSAFTEANYIRNEDQLESMLFASYSRLSGYFAEVPQIGLLPPANLPTQYFMLGNIGSDDSEKGGWGDGDWHYTQDISLSRQNADNLVCRIWWAHCYGLIESCNIVIQNAEELLKDPDMDEDRLESIADQARYLRAFGYYHLVTLFGDVPLRTTIFNPNEPFMERTDKSRVWDQIVEDLTLATDLPPKSSQNQAGRVTQGAVYSLLGKVYMWLKDYEKAVETYTAIIESGEYNLVPDYGFIHRWDMENNEESIFEFQSAVNVDGGNVANWAAAFRLPRDNPKPGWGFGFDNPSQDLVDKFEEGDPRLLYTVIFNGDVFPRPGVNDTIINDLPYSGYYCRKAWLPLEEDLFGTWFFYDYNWRFSRYAEVLLFCAEALNELGDSGRALEYVNRVRKRARETSKEDPERISTVWDSTYTGELLPDITTSDPDELRRAIWHEQRVELAMEGHRRWILLRTGRFKERMEAAKGNKGCTVEDHEWLLPIHYAEIEATRGSIKQNPGY